MPSQNMTDFINAILGGFAAKINPQGYAQSQENQRFQQQQAWAQQQHQDLMAHQAAQLKQQQEAQTFAQGQAQESQARQDRGEQQRANEWIATNQDRLTPIQPTQGIDFSRLQMGGASGEVQTGHPDAQANLYN